jgi:hypothetical protein
MRISLWIDKLTYSEGRTNYIMFSDGALVSEVWTSVHTSIRRIHFDFG